MVLYQIALSRTALYRIMLYCTVSCCVVLKYTVFNTGMPALPVELPSAHAGLESGAGLGLWQRRGPQAC